MNLIEQLGGYSEAKKQGEEWGFDDHLSNALLEYRRANNIFEVGDRIVYRNEPILRSVVEVRTIKSVGEKSVWSYSEDKYNFATEVYFHQIRHATLLEIAAGHRLN